MSFSFTVVSSTVPARLCKVMRLAPDGTLKAHPAASMTEGVAERREAVDLHDLTRQLGASASNEAAVWGVCAAPRVRIVTLDALASNPGAVARSREHFTWPRSAVLMLDHDGNAPGAAPFLTHEAVRAALIAACPALDHAPMLIRSSSSAGVCTADGREVTPRAKWRIYVAVSDGPGIPAAGLRLQTLLWAEGHGWAMVSKAGRVLLRTIVDGAVWQPERLDFVAPPELHDGLQRAVVAPVIYNADAALFDLRQIVVTPDIEAYSRLLKAVAVAGAESQAAVVREAYAAERAPALATRTGRSLESVHNALVSGAVRTELPADFPLEFADGTVCTVADVMADKAAFHNKRLADPLEPDYGNDRRIAVLYTDGREPLIVSHAHGGQQYTFEPSAIATATFGVVPAPLPFGALPLSHPPAQPHSSPLATVNDAGVPPPQTDAPAGPLVAVAAPAGAAVTSLTFAAAAQGWIDAKLETVADALASVESGLRIGLDSFAEQIMLADANGAWRPLTDADYGRLRATFGRRGFKAIAAEIMRTAVLMVAEDRRFDSAQDWVRSLQWDGVPRIDSALPVYYRTTDTPYTRAVGSYLFTAMAGRALVPGCQADMVPVLIGLQGDRKTSAVRALCPDRRFFAEINFKKIDDDNMARNIRGKLIGEIAELRGLRGRDQESTKAWITRRDETWCPKYREFQVNYPRRIVFIGTSNEHEFLDDPTGERRWLPVEAGAVDVEAIERDRDQLWAEGAARFMASGIAWRDAEQLARAEHAKFKLTDAWQDLVQRWLDAPTLPGGLPHGVVPFTLQDVATGALCRNVQSLGRPDELRLAKVLRSLGFDKRDGRIDGVMRKVWVRPPVALAAQR